MIRIFRCTLPVLCVGLFLTLSAAAQTAPPAGQPGGPGGQMPGGPGGPGGGARAPQPPKNLKVLPDNTNLRVVMRAYSGALGVECEFCHVGRDPVTNRDGDRASDANPMKDVARSMIKMTMDLNEKYLTMLPKNVPNVDADAKVECGTCHQGHSKPVAFVPPPRQPGNRPPGAPPAGAPPAGGPPPTP